MYYTYMRMPIYSYAVVAAIAAALLAVSVARERERSGRSAHGRRLPPPGAIALRFLHLFVFSYVVCFLAFFSAKSWDAVAYVLFCIFISYHWIIFGCCLLSLYELKTYSRAFGHLPTTHHPTMNSLFGSYDQIAMLVIGFVMIVTLAFILAYNEHMSTIVKAASGLALAGSIGYSQYVSRVLGQTFYRDISR
jgi:hypothetical protein